MMKLKTQNLTDCCCFRLGCNEITKRAPSTDGVVFAIGLFKKNFNRAMSLSATSKKNSSIQCKDLSAAPHLTNILVWLAVVVSKQQSFFHHHCTHTHTKTHIYTNLGFLIEIMGAGQQFQRLHFRSFPHNFQKIFISYFILNKLTKFVNESQNANKQKRTAIMNRSRVQHFPIGMVASHTLSHSQTHTLSLCPVRDGIFFIRFFF